MFSFFAVLYTAIAVAATILFSIIAVEGYKKGGIWKEFRDSDAKDWGAMGICQGILSAILLAVFSLVNYAALPSIYPPPQAHKVVEFGPVYDLNFQKNTITFETSRNIRHEEEGFVFEWTEGIENDISFNASSNMIQKIKREMKLNRGKRHVATFKGVNKLVSFYPSE